MGEVIVDAVRFLADTAGGGFKIGLAAISYSAGPAILAALDPDLQDRIGYVLAIGGYYDSESVITFFMTGEHRHPTGGPWVRGTVFPYGRWVFVHSVASRIGDAGDRFLLRAMADRRLTRPDASIEELVARLGPEGRAVHALLVNDDPDRVPELIAALPESVRRYAEALDLSRRDLTALPARLILVHGRDDPIIPYTESLALAAAGPPGRTELHVLENLRHVEIGPGTVLDGVRLWRAVYGLLEARDESRPPGSEST